MKPDKVFSQMVKRRAIKHAKKLQKYCLKRSNCYKCPFQNKGGECNLAYCPPDWEWEEGEK